MAGEYDDHARAMRDKLNAVSPSLCIAKWAQVSINLPAGLTQSCYHPPAHPIPLVELKDNPGALHNTKFKIHERLEMLEGKRPEGCSYCWKIEDAGHLSDRAYRSSEWWAEKDFYPVVDGPMGSEVTPRYVEVNFNQACNFGCMYCSPHLSTTWEEDINKFGPYKLLTGPHNDIAALQAKGIMPLKVANKDNPYVQAFWEWWPTIYRKLRVFRMTGGEPLMDKNTFKVLDYVNEHPHGQLELSITSNLCPPKQELFDKFMAKVKALEEVRTWVDPDNFNSETNSHTWKFAAVRHIMLFVSLDGVGQQAEYMRHGLNYAQLLANVRTYLNETSYTSISFINTFNILSIPSFKQFLEMILTLRKEFGGRIQTGDQKHQRVWFDVPILEYPHWFSILNATQQEVNTLQDCITFMKENVQQDNYLDTFEGIKPYEILKVERNLGMILNQPLKNADTLETNRAVFYEFVTQYNGRKGLAFLLTFPELKDYYLECRAAYIKKAKENKHE